MDVELEHARLAPNRVPKSVVARHTKELLKYVNVARQRRGLQVLRLSRTLSKIAKLHTLDQAFLQMRFTHLGADGSEVGERFKRHGYFYRNAGENVAWHFANARQVFDAWMKSPGHRANILSPKVVEMGMYVCAGQDGFLYWTQTFGKRK